MRTLFQAMLALVVVLGVIAVAPGRALAQDCVTRHASWVSWPPAGKRRIERVQIVQVDDTDGWTGHATSDLALFRRGTGGRSLDELDGTAQMAFSDRRYCTGPGCSLMQGFSIFDVDPLSIVIYLLHGDFGDTHATLAIKNERWGLLTNAGSGRCVNDNTVLFTIAGRATFFVTLTDVELPL
jgi:hypothetical protein